MEENKKSPEAEQIEEMANAICEMSERNAYYYDEHFQRREAYADVYNIANALYNVGYRKIGVVVREIYKKIQKVLSSMEYKTNTSRKTVRIEELIEQMDWVLHRVVPCAISEVLMKYESQEASNA